jgi:hypothetical protein
MDIYELESQYVLDRISKHCPEALSAYLQCINRADQKGKTFFSHELVEVDMSMSWSKFRNNIKKLALEDLIEWSPLNEGIAISLVDFNENI